MRIGSVEPRWGVDDVRVVELTVDEISDAWTMKKGLVDELIENEDLYKPEGF